MAANNPGNRTAEHPPLGFLNPTRAASGYFRCWASKMMRKFARLAVVVASLSTSYVPTAFAEAPDIEGQIASACSNAASSKQTVERLPIELRKYRSEIEALEEQSSVAMQQKGEVLRQKGQWSDTAEEKFFRKLVSSDEFQNYERQRSKLVQAYMQMSEAALDAVIRENYDQACKTSVLMGMFMKDLHALTEGQWRFMLSEKDIALAKSIQPSRIKSTVGTQQFVPADGQPATLPARR